MLVDPLNRVLGKGSTALDGKSCVAENKSLLNVDTSRIYG